MRHLTRFHRKLSNVIHFDLIDLIELKVQFALIIERFVNELLLLIRYKRRFDFSHFISGPIPNWFRSFQFIFFCFVFFSFWTKKIQFKFWKSLQNFNRLQLSRVRQPKQPHWYLILCKLHQLSLLSKLVAEPCFTTTKMDQLGSAT